MENFEQITKKINVLVADDMDAMRSMISSCLREIGVERVTLAINGDLAWRALKSAKIHMIVCDWDMPEVTGLEFLKRIRESEQYRDIPFLMLTATTDKAHVTEAIKAGVSDYLAKPFQPKELEYRVLKLLRKVKFT